MMGRRGVLGALLGSAALVLSGCNPFWNGYRYKMTVEVQTPQGVKSGYTVRQVSFYARPNGGDRAMVKGEAVAVDVAQGKTLFVLLTGADGDVDYASWIASWALDRKLSPGGANKAYDAGDFAELYPTAPRTESPIYFGALPMLVMFDDIRDPKSVMHVDPANLAARFGSGVKLKRVTVEKTYAGVTTGIGERLGWLGKFPEPRLDSSYKGSTNPNISQKLSYGDFVMGAK